MIGRLITRRRELALVAEAVWWLILAGLWLRILPFRRIAAALRPRVTGTPIPHGTTRIAWAVTAAARRMPFGAVCFHQGIAAQRMLCRRGVTARLCYGVAKAEGGGLEAHVWVTAGPEMVVGGAQSERYTLLTSFEPLGRRGERL